MAWPKAKKQAKEHKAATPESEETPSEESAAPQGDTLPDLAEGYCRACNHLETMHYDGKERQCNTSGCGCLRMTK